MEGTTEFVNGDPRHVSGDLPQGRCWHTIEDDDSDRARRCGLPAWDQAPEDEPRCAFHSGTKPEDLSQRLQDAARKGASVRDAHLEEAEIAGVRLPCADLVLVHLDDADLEGADLRMASLDRVRLPGANLEHADLRLASLDRVWLQGATLEGARLEAATLDRVHLEGANLWGADLRLACLDRVHLEGADLGGAHLALAVLERVYLDGANLTDAIGLTWDQLRQAKSLNGARLPAYLLRAVPPDIAPELGPSGAQAET